MDIGRASAAWAKLERIERQSDFRHPLQASTHPL
jgi:hypothetical protein